MQTNTKAFTLVEMIVAMAVSTIIISATYASYDLVATQYKKNLDVAEMHTSGRAIMQMIERDVRMAGFEYRDKDAKVTYGPITEPLVIKDSGNQCCDEVTVIYDYYDEDSKKVERIRIHYWTESHTSNKGDRYRLYKKIDVLGRDNAILARPIKLDTEINKGLLADFLEDFQIVNNFMETQIFTYNVGAGGNIDSIRTTYYNNYPFVFASQPSYLKGGGNPDSILVFTLTSRFYVSYYKQSEHGTDSDGVGASNTGGSYNLYMGKTVSGLSRSSGSGSFSIGSTGNKDTFFNVTCASHCIDPLVNIILTLRTRNPYGKDRQFKKKDYHAGNYNLDKTDKYKRDTFSSTVTVRNMAL